MEVRHLPGTPSVTTDRLLKWQYEMIGNIKKLVLYIYAEEGIWLRYTQRKYFEPDTVIIGFDGKKLSSLGYRTAQKCLSLGFKYDTTIEGEYSQ